MDRSDISLVKYWVTQSGYFRLATTVELVIVITYGNIIYCYSVVEENGDRKTSTLEYNKRKVYDCFNNPFTNEFGRPALNITPITFDDIP